MAWGDIMAIVVAEPAKSFKRKFNTKRLFIKLVALILIFLGLFMLLDSHMRPIILRISESKSKMAAAEIINQTVYDILEGYDSQYSAFVNLNYNNEGEVISVESNMIAMNFLKTSITKGINQDIKKLENIDLSFPIGTATGVQMLNARGPKLPLHAVPVGYVTSKLASKFSEAGINQTLHQIILEVSVDISAIIPGYTSKVNFHTNYILTQTVISGRVPDAYTYVVTGDEQFIDEINDYNASTFLE